MKPGEAFQATPSCDSSASSLLSNHAGQQGAANRAQEEVDGGGKSGRGVSSA